MQLLGNILTNSIPSNPYKQPAFALWSNVSTYGGFSTYDHNLNCIGRYMMNNNGFGSSAIGSTGSPELFDTNYTVAYTKTNANTSTTANYPTGCSNTGYLGHIVFPMGEGVSGDMVGPNANTTYRATAFRDLGTIVNEVDQKYAIWLSSTNFVVGPRSATWYYTNTQSLANNKLTISDKQSGFTGAKYGNVSYNAKTNQMCIIEASASYTFKPTVYSNVPKLSQYTENQYLNMTDQSAARTALTSSDLYTFFNTASNYVLTYATSTGKPSNNGTEDNGRCIPVMCDNGKIVMFQMIPSTGAWVHRWNADGTAAGSVINMTYTTSYGIDQGIRYGARYVVSSDGRYVLAYCPSYYYHSGYQAALIRVSDGKVLHDYNNDSTNGYHFTPIGKSDFLVSSTVNADGSGLSMNLINSDYLMYTTADVGRIDMGRTMKTQLISTNYNSTDYPCLIPLQYDTKVFSTF